MAEPVAERMENLTVEEETPQAEGGEAGLSKKQQKKLAKQAEKEAKKATNQQQRGQKAQIITQADPEDPCRDNYGDAPMVQSRGVSGRTWSRLDKIKPEHAGSKVLLRARLHAVRGKGKLAFVVLRQRMNTVQCVMFADNEVISKTMVTYATQIPRESIVDLEGMVTVPKEPIDSCTVSGIELGVMHGPKTHPA